jgi:hypothetical protein
MRSNLTSCQHFSFKPSYFQLFLKTTIFYPNSPTYKISLEPFVSRYEFRSYFKTEMGTQEFYFENSYLNKSFITEEECLACISDKDLILLYIDLKEQEKKYLKEFFHYLESKSNKEVFTIPSGSAEYHCWKKSLHYSTVLEIVEKEKERRKSKGFCRE